MALDPSYPIYPEADISLLQNGAEPILTVPAAPYSSPDFQVPNDQIQPEVDISLLPGVPGQRGPRGFSGDPAHFIGVYDSPALLLAAYPSPVKTSDWGYAKDPTNPLNLWVYFPDTNGAWTRAGIPLIKGDKGDTGPVGPSAVTAFTYTPADARNSWYIAHNLGFYPNVRVQDSVGTEYFGTVTYNSINAVTIDFSSAVYGTAYLS